MWLPAIAMITLLVVDSQAFVQEKLRVDLAIGETENNLDLAGNATQIPVSRLVSYRAIAEDVGSKSYGLVAPRRAGSKPPPYERNTVT